MASPGSQGHPEREGEREEGKIHLSWSGLPMGRYWRCQEVPEKNLPWQLLPAQDPQVTSLSKHSGFCNTLYRWGECVRLPEAACLSVTGAEDNQYTRHVSSGCQYFPRVRHHHTTSVPGPRPSPGSTLGAVGIQRNPAEVPTLERREGVAAPVVLCRELRSSQSRLLGVYTDLRHFNPGENQSHHWHL